MALFILRVMVMHFLGQLSPDNDAVSYFCMSGSANESLSVS